MQRTERDRTARANGAQRALLERARKGDAAAYDAIVTARLPAAHQLARAILGAQGDADDAASCALVAAWHELHRLEDLDRFDDWLDRIVISECRMRLDAAAAAANAGLAMPADLAERTMLAVRARPRAGRPRRGGPVLVVGLALAVPALAVALLILGQGPGGRPSPPTPGAQASADPGGGTAPSGGVPPSGATPPSTGESHPPGTLDGLATGAMAVVTLDGDNLRVRTSPGVGDPATRLKPLLPAGTRMLLVDGPVSVDGLEWWEIQTDGELVDLFGWVAAGDDGDSWIAPAVPRCWGELGAATVTGLDRIDFLACYGHREVRLQARAAGLWDVRPEAGACGWLREDGACDVDTAWLLLPAAKVSVITESGAEHAVTLAMPPDLSAALMKLPRQSTLLLTVSMDAPEAATCRARDARTGANLISDHRAVTFCRLQFVVQEVAFRDPVAGASDAPSD
jgi:hypothetical protein